MRFRVKAGLSMASAAAVIGVAACCGVNSAGAVSIDMSPNDPQFASNWLNPSARDGVTQNQIGVQFSSITPSIPRVGESLSFSVTVTNTSQSPLSGLGYELVMANPAVDTATARLRLVDGKAVFGRLVYSASIVDNGGVLNPGQSTTLQFVMPVGQSDHASSGQEDSGTISARLPVYSAGVYPLMFSVSGSAEGTAVSGSSRLLVPVGEQQAQPVEQRTPVTFIWPLTAESTVVPGETGDAPNPAALVLSDDTLATELRAGGRLDTLLASYSDAVRNSAGLKQAGCLAIDPDLLRVVKRMTSGYEVSSERKSVVTGPTRLRDSWWSDNEVHAIRGSGQQDATEWLQRLTDIAQTSCVVALPSANANLDAVAQTQDPWLATQTLSTGAATIKDILGVQPVDDVVIPGAGAVRADTLSMLNYGLTSKYSADAGYSLESLFEKSTDGKPADWPSTAGRVTLLSASSTVQVTESPDSQERTNPWDAALVAASSTVTVAPFDADVAATLASTGATPNVMGYSAPITRYTESLDSESARMESAIAVLWQAARNRAGAPLLVVPPSYWSPAKGDADTLLRALSRIVSERGTATPLSAIQAAGARGARSTGTVAMPFSDPAVPTDVDVRKAAQQALSVTRITQFLRNDPRIALTRVRFTSPLRLDLLRALSENGRRHRTEFDQRVTETAKLLAGNSVTVRQLSTGVALIPPGNVYTRMSASSPVLIVARNGLPLPVAANLAWSGDAGKAIAPDAQTIPARGSITLQLGANIPVSSEQIKLNVWLVSPQGQAMSESVLVAVQTASGLSIPGVVAIAVVVAIIGGVGYIARVRRRNE